MKIPYICIKMPERSDHIHRYEVGKIYYFDGKGIHDEKGIFLCGVGSKNFKLCMREYGIVFKLLSL